MLRQFKIYLKNFSPVFVSATWVYKSGKYFCFEKSDPNTDFDYIVAQFRIKDVIGWKEVNDNEI